MYNLTSRQYNHLFSDFQRFDQTEKVICQKINDLQSCTNVSLMAFVEDVNTSIDSKINFEVGQTFAVQ